MRSLCLALAVVVACTGPGEGIVDAAIDSGPSVDAAAIDTAVEALDDASAIDASPIDASSIDAIPIDAAAIDANPVDAAVIDAPAIDAAAIDAATVDAATVDAIPVDAPTPIDAAVDASPVCVPGCDATGTVRITCDATGAPQTEPCAQGCSPSPTPHCGVFAPANGATAADLAGVTAALVVPSGRTFLFDSSDGSIDSFDSSVPVAAPIAVRGAGDGVIDGIAFRRAAQGAAQPGLAIWAVDTLTTEAGPSLALHGTARFVGPRAAVVLARGAIAVLGAVDVGAGHDLDNHPCATCGGAGGGTGGSHLVDATGCARGGKGFTGISPGDTGGAGGGMGTLGAYGGTSLGPGGGAVASGGIPTAITTCPGASLAPLAGGSGGGGAGNARSRSPSTGGGAGGGLQLSSFTALTVGATADLYAGGHGGLGSDRDGGGGGGAGGGLLLEAPTVTIAGSARITANGGGGGSGRFLRPGEAGRRSRERAPGGTGDTPGNPFGDPGAGGVGGTGADTTADELVPTEGFIGHSLDGTGGGGGAAGRIRIHAAAAPTIAAPAVVCPTLTFGVLQFD